MDWLLSVTVHNACIFQLSFSSQPARIKTSKHHASFYIFTFMQLRYLFFLAVVPHHWMTGAQCFQTACKSQLHRPKCRNQYWSFVQVTKYRHCVPFLPWLLHYLIIHFQWFSHYDRIKCFHFSPQLLIKIHASNKYFGSYMQVTLTVKAEIL